MRLSSLSSLVLLGLTTTARAISTVSALGNKFFYENGTQFFIKGVAYQLTSDDPLLDKTQCALDASLMQDLGANTIRVYHVDASKDHKDCMTAFSDAGIYVLADLDTFDTYILPVRPVPAHPPPLSLFSPGAPRGPPLQASSNLNADPTSSCRLAPGGIRPSTNDSPRLWMSSSSTTTPWV